MNYRPKLLLINESHVSRLMTVIKCGDYKPLLCFNVFNCMSTINE